MINPANLEEAEPWDFSKHPAADLVIINLGTNDRSYNISGPTYQDSLTKIIEGIHGVWPEAQVMIMVSQLALIFLVHPPSHREPLNIK